MQMQGKCPASQQDGLYAQHDLPQPLSVSLLASSVGRHVLQASAQQFYGWLGCSDVFVAVTDAGRRAPWEEGPDRMQKDTRDAPPPNPKRPRLGEKIDAVSAGSQGHEPMARSRSPIRSAHCDRLCNVNR